MASQEQEKTLEVPSEGNVFLYGADGKPKEQFQLPPHFSTPYRPDLIRKDFIASAANRRQAYGSMKRAGMRHSVETWGKGRGVARIQRIKGQSTGAQSPNNVGGRRAHPPKQERQWYIKINEKERKFAKHSALAASGNKELVVSRGHRFSESVCLPVVFDDDIESISKSSEFEQVLGSLGIIEDIARVRDGTHIRAGRGKMRNRRYREPVGPLVVVSSMNVPLAKSARNLAGVSIATPASLNTEKLAPGGDAGRLVLFSRKAIEMMRGV
jgi:large subunit ribosomal protein L4e